MYYVYHIVDPRDNSLTRGYIGVTKQELVERFKDHQRGNRIIGKAIRALGLTSESIHLLFSYSTAAEAYAKEEELRPDNFMGWNQCKGGRGGGAGPISEEARESRRRNALRGSDNPRFGIS
jgi:predicted GIY-YIG superfamily endonuclease